VGGNQAEEENELSREEREKMRILEKNNQGAMWMSAGQISELCLAYFGVRWPNNTLSERTFFV
jgi:hypothetical protein